MFDLSHAQKAKLLVTLHEALGISLDENKQDTHDAAIAERITLIVECEPASATMSFAIAEALNVHFGDSKDAGVSAFDIQRQTSISLDIIYSALRIAGFFPLDQAGCYGRSWSVKIVKLPNDIFEFVPGAEPKAKPKRRAA